MKVVMKIIIIIMMMIIIIITITKIVGEMQKTVLMDNETTIRKVLSGLVQSEHTVYQFLSSRHQEETA